MIKEKWFGLFALLALTVSACSASPRTLPAVTAELTSSPADNLPQTEADVPRVTAEAALAALNNGEAIIVDVRISESFAAGHIEGSVSIPLAKIENDPSSLPLDKNLWIITYCT
jgi:3-mercaptopyruvate sulfurtransferase SseA